MPKPTEDGYLNLIEGQEHGNYPEKIAFTWSHIGIATLRSSDLEYCLLFLHSLFVIY